jgi:hypothetical protein
MNIDSINTDVILILLGIVIAILGSGLAISGIVRLLKRGNDISTCLTVVAIETQSLTTALKENHPARDQRFFIQPHNRLVDE